MKIVGILRKCGDFRDDKGKEVVYDNLYLHCTQKEQGAIGELTSIHKIPIATADSVFGCPNVFEILETLVGENVYIYYNEKKRVMKVECYEPVSNEREVL